MASVRCPRRRCGHALRSHGLGKNSESRSWPIRPPPGPRRMGSVHGRLCSHRSREPLGTAVERSTELGKRAPRRHVGRPLGARRVFHPSPRAPTYAGSRSEPERVRLGIWACLPYGTPPAGGRWPPRSMERPSRRSGPDISHRCAARSRDWPCHRPNVCCQRAAG